MQISISASGAPNDAAQNITQQIKRARTEHPVLSASLASLQDDLVGAVRKADGTVTVQATIDVRMSVAPTPESAVRRLDGQPQSIAADGLIHGDPVTRAVPAGAPVLDERRIPSPTIKRGGNE
jgi:hypothetical protein